ncbi:MAG: hypothetical protein ABH811_02280, partial [archaeon]
TTSATPVTPPGGGGSSGSSSSSSTTTTTPAPNATIEEELFDIDFSKEESGSIEIKQGEIKTFSFNNKVLHEIVISEIINNSIKLIIRSNPIILALNLGETKQVDMNKDKINDLEIKLISIINSKAKFSLTKLEGADIVAEEELEEAIRKEALFDVKVSIVNLFEVVRSGREVIVEIEAFNVNNIGRVDIGIDYYITSKEDNQTKLVEGSDTLAVEAVASFVRSLAVPYNTKAGKYLFNVDVKYQDKLMASGSSEFRVVRNYEIIIVGGIFVLIVVGIFVYLIIIRRKEKLMESKIKKMEKWGWKTKK